MLGNRASLPPVLRHRVQNLTNQFLGRFHLVFNILGNQGLHSGGVKLPQHRQEVLQVVILAAQADDQHSARIGMANHALENVLCIQEVISHLGAAGVMGEGKDAVTSAGETLLSSLLNQANGGVHAGNRGNNPQLVSGSHPAICSAVAQEGISSSDNPGRPLVALGLVAVGQLAGQVGVHIVHMNPVARLDGLCGMANHRAILYNVLSRSNGPQGHLVPEGDILPQHNLGSSHGDLGSLCGILGCYCHGILGMYLYKRFFHNLSSF